MAKEKKSEMRTEPAWKKTVEDLTFSLENDKNVNNGLIAGFRHKGKKGDMLPIPFDTENGLLALSCLINCGALKAKATARRNRNSRESIFVFNTPGSSGSLSIEASASGYVLTRRDREKKAIDEMEISSMDAAVLASRINAEFMAYRTRAIYAEDRVQTADEPKQKAGGKENVMIIYDAGGKVNDGRPVAVSLENSVHFFTGMASRMSEIHDGYSKNDYEERMDGIKKHRKGSYFVRFGKGEVKDYLVALIGEVY